jgi:hypothetical protein
MSRVGIICCDSGKPQLLSDIRDQMAVQCHSRVRRDDKSAQRQMRARDGTFHSWPQTISVTSFYTIHINSTRWAGFGETIAIAIAKAKMR